MVRYTYESPEGNVEIAVPDYIPLENGKYKARILESTHPYFYEGTDLRISESRLDSMWDEVR